MDEIKDKNDQPTVEVVTTEEIEPKKVCIAFNENGTSCDRERMETS